MFGGNMQGMMKQMKKLQKEMADTQEELSNSKFTGASSNDYVIATVNGDKELLDIEIKPEVVDPDDVELLQDLIVEALKKATATADATQKQKMGKFTAGMPSGLF
ncbi:MAG: YbaB/EbfC family nucleoid-associated protein [Lactobacillales bacterium]|jgi:DNA-binding YbaB/EbfC family protein|nr:YbaB/EbfC family nucleoid-associated protein [Lactobacillales bacterium]